MAKDKEPMGRKRIGTVRAYFVASLSFGLLMGTAFPVYASFFVTYRDTSARAIFIAGCLAAGALVGLFAFFIGKLTLLRVVDNVSCRLSSLAEGGADLGARMDEGTMDAFGRLARSFNRFVDSLSSTVSVLGEVAERTKQVGFELAANSTETSAASEQISRHMESIHEQTDILLQEIENVHQSREQISLAAEDVAAAINRQSGSLTRLSSIVEGTVEEVRGIAGTTSHEAGMIAASVAGSADSLEDIDEVSRKIGEIEDGVRAIGELTSAIDGIAESITILGMNAAIEAAHAGDAGRGFAVVAAEIGKLSELAGQNAEGIEKGLSEVSDRVAEGVRLADEARERLASLFSGIDANALAIGQMSKRFEDLITRTESMLAAHNDLVRVTLEVTDSMMSMRDSTGVIEESVNTLQSSADTYTLAIDEVSQGIREIAIDVSHLQRVSSVNSENTEGLRVALGRLAGGIGRG